MDIAKEIARRKKNLKKHKVELSSVNEVLESGLRFKASFDEAWRITNDTQGIHSKFDEVYNIITEVHRVINDSIVDLNDFRQSFNALRDKLVDVGLDINDIPELNHPDIQILLESGGEPFTEGAYLSDMDVEYWNDIESRLAQIDL
jgi:uncharacterized coiled-coil DUF342 family protein